MEIAILSKNSLRIKGKNAVLSVDPQDKQDASAALIFPQSSDSLNTDGAEVIIDGPGEYETGGIKITATKYDEDLVYSLTVDSVSILIGNV